MQLLTFGLNHQSAPLAMRERVAFAGESLVKAALDLKSSVGALLRESAILSTCNRTEIYAASANPQAASLVKFERTPTCYPAIKPYVMPFVWQAVLTRWCLARRKFSDK